MYQWINRMSRTLVALLGLSVLSLEVQADDAVHIPDMSELSWQIDSAGRVWFRNLDEFDSSFQACCYVYYLDTVPAEGKTRWSTMLSYMAMGKPMTIYVQSKAGAAPVTVTYLMN